MQLVHGIGGVGKTTFVKNIAALGGGFVHLSGANLLATATKLSKGGGTMQSNVQAILREQMKKRHRAKNKKLVIFIDEFDNMPPEVLQGIKELTNELQVNTVSFILVTNEMQKFQEKRTGEIKREYQPFFDRFKLLHIERPDSLAIARMILKNLIDMNSSGELRVQWISKRGRRDLSEEERGKEYSQQAKDLVEELLEVPAYSEWKKNESKKHLLLEVAALAIEFDEAEMTGRGIKSFLLDAATSICAYNEGSEKKDKYLQISDIYKAAGLEEDTSAGQKKRAKTKSLKVKL